MKRLIGNKNIPPWTILLGIGVLCLLIGITQNQFTLFFRKAVMICLECIGIG